MIGNDNFEQKCKWQGIRKEGVHIIITYNRQFRRDIERDRIECRTENTIESSFSGFWWGGGSGLCGWGCLVVNRRADARFVLLLVDVVWAVGAPLATYLSLAMLLLRDMDLGDISKSLSDRYRKDSRRCGRFCSTRPALGEPPSNGDRAPGPFSTSKLRGAEQSGIH